MTSGVTSNLMKGFVFIITIASFVGLVMYLNYFSTTGLWRRGTRIAQGVEQLRLFTFRAETVAEGRARDGAFNQSDITLDELAPVLPLIANVTQVKRTRVLCWIMCDPNDLDRRVMHVRDTWAKRCDVTLFMSSEKNDTFPTVGLNVPAGRSHIGMKSRAAWTYIYHNHFHDADYFYKADPDTYCIVENLREFLSHRDPNNPEYFGHHFKLPRRNFTYMSGGPGLAISREALRRLVTQAFQLQPDCMPDGQGEDWKSAYCMTLVGGRAVWTADEEGRERFMVWNPESMVSGRYPNWFYKWDQNDARAGMPGCCHDYPIAFHYCSPPLLRALDYLFYTAKLH